MADSTTETIFSGARALAYFGATPLADLQGCRVQVRYDRRPHKPCNSLTVKEHTTLGKYVSLSADWAWRVDTDEADDLGLHDYTLQDAIENRVMDVVIMDTTGKVLGVVNGVRLGEHGFGFTSDAQAAHGLQFVAQDCMTMAAIARAAA